MFNVTTRKLLLLCSLGRAIFCMEESLPVSVQEISKIEENRNTMDDSSDVIAKRFLDWLEDKWYSENNVYNVYKELFCGFILLANAQLDIINKVTQIGSRLLEVNNNTNNNNMNCSIYYAKDTNVLSASSKNKKEIFSENNFNNKNVSDVILTGKGNVISLTPSNAKHILTVFCSAEDYPSLSNMKDNPDKLLDNDKSEFYSKHYPYFFSNVSLNLMYNLFQRLAMKCHRQCTKKHLMLVSDIEKNLLCEHKDTDPSVAKDFVKYLFESVTVFKDLNNFFGLFQRFIKKIVISEEGFNSGMLKGFLDQADNVKKMFCDEERVIVLIKQFYNQYCMQYKLAGLFVAGLTKNSIKIDLSTMFLGIGNADLNKPFSNRLTDLRNGLIEELLADYRNTKANPKPIKNTKIQQGGSKNNKDKNKKKYHKHVKNSNNDSLKPVKNNTRYKKINNDKKDNSRNYLSLEEKRELLIEQIKSAPLFCVEPYYRRCKNIKESGEEKASPYHTYPYLLDFATRVFGLPINEEKNRTSGYYMPCRVLRDEISFSMVYVILCYFVGDDKDKRCVEFHRGPAMLNTIIPDSFNVENTKNMYQELKASLRKEPFYRKPDGVYDNGQSVLQIDPFNNDFSGNVIFSKQANYITIEDHYNNQVIEVPMIFNV